MTEVGLFAKLQTIKINQIDFGCRCCTLAGHVSSNVAALDGIEHLGTMGVL